MKDEAPKLASSDDLAWHIGLVDSFIGDLVVARDGTRLPLVWVLIGCLGGFEVLGLVGLVIGPVVLTLVRELWEQRLPDVASETDVIEV